MIPPAITVDDVEGEADCRGKSKKVGGREKFHSVTGCRLHTDPHPATSKRPTGGAKKVPNLIRGVPLGGGYPYPAGLSNPLPLPPSQSTSVFAQRPFKPTSNFCASSTFLFCGLKEEGE